MIFICLLVYLLHISPLYSVVSDGEFEELEIAPLSTPPELPDVMKPQESASSHAQEQVTS